MEFGKGLLLRGKNFQAVAKVMDKGPDDAEVQQCVGEYRANIIRSYYQCSLEIFRDLGQLYVSDSKFHANINQ
jgi:hypothetical protein